MTVCRSQYQRRRARPARSALVALVAALFGALLGAGTAGAQQPVSLKEATDSALARGSRVGVGRTDTLSAAALVSIARAWQNPSLSASYTKDQPSYHVSLDVPLDLPHIRRLRIQAARASRDASLAGLELTRAIVRFDVQNAYTEALAAAGRADLSRETLRDASRLLGMVRARRDAGDASEMDVELAEVESSQSASAFADDSLRARSSVLALQLQMGMPAETLTIKLTDSLPALVSAGGLSLAASGLHRSDTLAVRDSAAGAAAAVRTPTPGREPLRVAAAAATLRSREREVDLARRRKALVPSLLVGADMQALAGESNRPLPLFGLSVPVPLFNRYGGDVAFAEAQRERAAIELLAARIESRADLARAHATRDVASERVRRGQAAASTARRVAARALTAYQEGEAALPFVLQAQRSARETLSQLTDALAAAASAQAAIRLLSTDRSAP